MKVSCEKVYRVLDDKQAYMVRFVKQDKTPGFSHKVLILSWAPDGNLILLATDWLSDEFWPSRKTAIFFCEKHIT